MKLRLNCLAVAVIGTTMISPGIAVASPVPFSDPQANGFIGFCDGNNNPVTSGSLRDKPFVAKAVASTGAPDGYGPAVGGKATLYAFQPIIGIDPGDWSNSQLTAASTYTNQEHPMVDATILDYSMREHVSAYPALWDSLVQLRMLYTGPNKPIRLQPYPATVIQVVGDRWQMVNPQTLPCNDGKAVSTERILLPASKFVPKPSASASASGARSGSAKAPGSTPNSSVGSQTSSAGRSPELVIKSKATSANSSSDGQVLGWVLGVIAFLAAAGGAVWWRVHRT